MGLWMQSELFKAIFSDAGIVQTPEIKIAVMLPHAGDLLEVLAGGVLQVFG